MWEFLPPKIRLLGSPRLTDSQRARLTGDFEKFREGLPRPLETYVLGTYGLDLQSDYGGRRVKNPFGKASGQLSLAVHQMERDAQAGLGFVVLKTLIAQDRAGSQSMHEWAIPETRMLVERITGRSGASGWTVTWKGRGWFDTFDAYLELFRQSLQIGCAADMLVIPSVKYHLPTPEENSWKEDEYNFTTLALIRVWQQLHANEPMPIEKDFSPTLAGSERATQQARILDWLKHVPSLIRGAALGKVLVGLKIFNALFEDSFQVEMLEALDSASEAEARADFLIYANRLFDPTKEFEGKTGVAYGGPDLSDRNLATLERHLAGTVAGATVRAHAPALPLSATGDIHSGRIAAEYMLRGASTFQMHTLFQLPDSEFAMSCGSKSEKAIHRLLFDPENGFISWLLDLRARCDWPAGLNIAQVSRWCRKNWRDISRALPGS